MARDDRRDRDRRRTRSRSRDRSRDRDRKRRRTRTRSRSKSNPGNTLAALMSNASVALADFSELLSKPKTGNDLRSQADALQKAVALVKKEHNLPIVNQVDKERESREVFISPLPTDYNAVKLKENLVNELVEHSIILDKFPETINNIWICHTLRFAIVEFKQADIAAKVGNILKQIELETMCSMSLYQRPTLTDSAHSHMVIIGNLSEHLDEISLRSLLEPFGGIRLLKIETINEETNERIAICVFQCSVSAEASIMVLHDLSVVGTKLYVKALPESLITTTLSDLDVTNAPFVLNPSSAEITSVSEITTLKTEKSLPANCTRVLRLSNMITTEDLENDADYIEIKQDVQEEFTKYGKIKSLQIPRNVLYRPGIEHGVGFVFVEFEKIEDANAARDSMQGKVFDGRRIEVSFFKEASYLMGNYASA